MKIKLLTLILFTLSFTAIAMPPLELKGVQVGKPVDCAVIAENHKQTAKPGFEESAYASMLERCNQATKDVRSDTPFVNHNNAMSYITLDSNRNVNSVRISHPELSFSEMVSGLTSKYGKPKTDTTTLMNGLGAKFEKITAKWIDKAGNTLLVSNRGTGGNYPSATLISVEMLKESLEKSKKSKENL